LVEYRRRRALELAAWTRTLTWRAPLIAAAGLAGQVLAIQTELLHDGLVGLAVAILVGWRQRFRLSEQVTAWRRGAKGERRTARLLDRLTRDGFVVFHDLAIPGSPANVDHLMIGSTGVFVIDSKQWTGTVHQSADGLAWHNHHRLDRTLETVRWEAQAISRLLGTRAAALLCVHGAHVHGGGLHAYGVAIVPAGGCATPSARTGCCRTPISSCWLPLPACGCGRPPDIRRIALRSAMVGEATRLGLNLTEQVPAASPRWRAGRGFFEVNEATRRAVGG
jgi:hypothetical protein